MLESSDTTFEAEHMDDFGQMLRQYRRKAGLTQNALAYKTGIHSSYISRIERGERQAPEREMVIKIIDALGLDTRDANELLLSAGYIPLPSRDTTPADPSLSLISDLFQDDRLSELELNPLREYAKLLDQLRQQR